MIERVYSTLWTCRHYISDLVWRLCSRENLVVSSCGRHRIRERCKVDVGVSTPQSLSTVFPGDGRGVAAASVVGPLSTKTLA